MNRTVKAWVVPADRRIKPWSRTMGYEFGPLCVVGYEYRVGAGKDSAWRRATITYDDGVRLKPRKARGRRTK
jgi:hypothetical protein